MSQQMHQRKIQLRNHQKHLLTYQLLSLQKVQPLRGCTFLEISINFLSNFILTSFSPCFYILLGRKSYIIFTLFLGLDLSPVFDSLEFVRLPAVAEAAATIMAAFLVFAYKEFPMM
mmetsp:Transcript_1432/g.2628  ORF Transcript_1432/g.2628 Transcript_1432/m.2628 type:complete len:116 (+) Transcript_1432:339-686(+)